MFVAHLVSSIVFSVLLFFLFIFCIHLGRVNLFFDISFFRLLGIVFLSSAVTVILREVQWYDFGKIVVCACVLDVGTWEAVQRCNWDLTKVKFVKSVLEEKKPKEESKEEQQSPTQPESPNQSQPDQSQQSSETMEEESLFKKLVGKAGIKRLEEDCIWAYVCKHPKEDFKKNVARAYVLLRIPSLDYSSQLRSIRVLENLSNAASLVVLVLWAFARVYPSVMNVFFVLLLWKLVHSVLDDGVFRLLFSSMIWSDFAEREWKEEYEETLEQMKKENATINKLKK